MITEWFHRAGLLPCGGGLLDSVVTFSCQAESTFTMYNLFDRLVQRILVFFLKHKLRLTAVIAYLY